MEEILKDERFKHIAKDPRFKRIPRSQQKVKIDKRFQSMFEDKRFKLKYTVDKRGRPINRTTTEDLEKFYHLSGSDNEDEESENEESSENIKDKRSAQIKQLHKEKHSKNKQSKTDEEVSSVSQGLSKTKIGGKEDMNSLNKSIRKIVESDSEENNETDTGSENDEDIKEEESAEERSGNEDDSSGSMGVRSDDETVSDDVKAKLKDMSVDYARGEGELLSDSSSDELTEDDEDDEEDVVHGWGELDKDADTVEESTSRLALCNMDWDRIRATDIMVLLNSFVPPGGLIRSVTIYPSDYGLERTKLEKERGPLELYGGSNAGSDEDESKDDTKYHMEKLRQYQLNRLKYFYAIIECDSVSTADHLYKECDGREYESSATRLDLRFVPDDTTFDNEPRERCTEMPDIRKYKPRNFLTTALQQSKVDLTWDETDPDRAALSSRVASGDIDDDDLKAYLASSTEDESDVSDDEKIKNIKKSKKKATREIEKSAEKNGDLSGAEENSDDDENLGESENEEEDDEYNSNDSDEGAIAKYRRALQSTAEEEEEEENKDVQMEITWDTNLQKKAEEAVKKKLEEKEDRTPFEEMMHRRREKKKEKQRQKAEGKGENADGGESDESDYIPADVDLDDPYFKEEYDKLEKGKKKTKKNAEETEEDAERKKWAQINSSKKLRQKKTRRELEEEAAKESNFKVDLSDDRFSALYTSHLFNIEPTDPNFRKTSGVEALINEKLQGRAKEPEKNKNSEPPRKKARVENGDGVSEEGGSKDSELSALVKSVKTKIQTLHSSKKMKQKDRK